MLYCKSCALDKNLLWLGNTRQGQCDFCRRAREVSDAPLAAISPNQDASALTSPTCVFNTVQQLRIVNALANDEYSTDQEIFDSLIDDFLRQDFPTPEQQQMLQRLIEQERPKFFTEVFHDVDWNQYSQ